MTVLTPYFIHRISLSFLQKAAGFVLQHAKLLPALDGGEMRLSGEKESDLLSAEVSGFLHVSVNAYT